MTTLNLPAFDARVRGSREKPEIFDFLRRRYVALTPEEWVRQCFTHFLVDHKGYPASLMANEVEVRLGEKRMRCDTVLYDATARPRMIIEYKAPSVNIHVEHVFHQIYTYNLMLHVNYLVVSNGRQHYCCHMDYAHNSHTFLHDLPDYQEL